MTISTNMAGRGTDIRLGGRTERYRDQVVALGGLYVIGTNRHESRRVDDQLRGRAGRQGDPGASRFIISLQDDPLRRFGIEEMPPPHCDARTRDEPIDDPEVTREIAHVQRVMEGQNLQLRRTLWQYSYAIDRQREIPYQRRLDLLSQRTPPTLLARRCAARYELLLAQVGPQVLEDVERQIALFHIDRCWSEYLDYVAHIREGLCLTGGGGNPLDMYHRTVGKAFRELLESIDDHIVETFTSAEIGADGIDMHKEGLKGPSSTWTYLVTDNPVGSWFERLYRTAAHADDPFKSLKRAVMDKSS